MKAPCLLLSLLIAASTADAGELRALTGGPGLRITGALSRLNGDAQRQPREALNGVATARRLLSGDSSIEADRLLRRLDDIDRDATRSLRRQNFATDLRWLASGSSGLPPPAITLPAYPRDIRGEDSVLGTGKAFIRIGRLLDRAEIAGAGSVAEATWLLDRALDADPTISADEPQVVATRARIARLAAISPASRP